MNQINSENDTSVHRNNTTNNKSESTEPSTIPYCQMYEKRLLDYMKSIPNIPPTQFELRLRHNDIKVDVLKQFKKIVNKTKPLLTKQLDNQIEKIYLAMAKRNIEEYKRCQAGFTIGWKCTDKKPQPKPQPTDDRF